MIKVDSIVIIQYLNNNFIQTKKIISTEHLLFVKANYKTYISLPKKEQDKFKRENKIELEPYYEIPEVSPMGSPMMNSKIGDICEMYLSENQGGYHYFKILNIQ